MDYSFIKIFHLGGIRMMFMGLGGMVFASYAGFGSDKKLLRRAAALIHGIGLFVILVSGVTMLNDLGLLRGDPPGWVKVKFGIFLLMGGSLSLAARMSRLIWFLIAAWLVLGATAAYLALYKPF